MNQESIVAASSHAIAEFLPRRQCIACGSVELHILDKGTYSEDPLRRYLQLDPWGISPLPYLEGCPWELVRCKICQQVFHKWLLSPDWQAIRFREWMSEDAIREFEKKKGLDTPQHRFAQASGSTKHVLRLEKMTRPIRGGSATRLLDFGCGFGDFLILARNFGFDAYGIDRAPDRQRVSAASGIRVFADLDGFRKENGRICHAVTMFQVLEHIEEPLSLLESIREVLMDDGVLVLEVPDCSGVHGIVTEFDYYAVHPLEHLNCFTPRTLSQIAKRAGFEAVSPAIAHVTAEPAKVAKGEVKRIIQRFLPKTTNQYFRRVH